jgi:3-oxoacyl-[acyl-carrier-protein] synthase-3
MDQIGVAATEIDVVIFGAASQDVSEPATASIIQSKLGCTNAFVFDVKNACSSFINSLDLALCLIEAHRASRVLVTSGEVLSLSIDWQIVSPSRSPEKLAGLTLGDGGAAAIVELSDEADESRLYPSELFSDGTLWEASTVYAGGSMYGFDQVRGYFECSSGPLVRAAAEHLPRLIDLACDRLGWTLDSVAAVVPHQVSAHHIDFLQSLGFRDGVVRQTVQHLGNVAAASIPITLSIEVAAGRIRRGDRVLLLSGAAGFNAGVTPIVW